MAALGLAWLFFFLFLSGPMSRDHDINVVMNPDSTRFAYAVDYHFYPGWFDLRLRTARVEIWTYDLAKRSGPHRTSGWPHDAGDNARLVQWTDKGLFLAYRNASSGEGIVPHAWCDLVSPENGFHVFIGQPPKRPKSVNNSNNPEGYRRIRHVEVRNGEFFLWDPVTMKLIALFALPIDSTLGADGARYLAHRREVVLREDGYQQVDRVDVAQAVDAVQLHVKTYARRPAPFARRYRLHVQVSSWDRPKPYETVEKFVAVWDTLVTPRPAGDELVVNVPYVRFWNALRPDWELIKEQGTPYGANLITTLVPDSLPGDKEVAPGLRHGTALWATDWTSVRIPLP